MKKFIILLFILLLCSCYKVFEVKPLQGDKKAVLLRAQLYSFDIEEIKRIYSEYSFIGEIPGGELILVK